jgi:hypothetical protein
MGGRDRRNAHATKVEEAVLGLLVVSVEARTDSDFEPAFATFVERRARALVVGPEPLDSNRGPLVTLAAGSRRGGG